MSQGESGWFVQRDGLTGPLYWSGTVFTGDFGEAIKFAGEIDAQRAIDRLHLANAKPAQLARVRVPAAPSWRDG